MSDNLSLRGLVESYKKWVSANPQKTAEFESTAKWISYFIAGRVNNSNLLSELIYTLSNLLVFYNDYIISKNRQLKSFKAGDKLKIWLSVLEYSEVFIEVTSRNLWGEKGRWIVIVLVQLIKSTARLVLLFNYKHGIINNPTIKPLKRYNLTDSDENDLNPNFKSHTSIAFKLKRSGRVIRTVESAPPVTCRLWKPPVLHNESKKKNIENALKPLKGSLLKAELLYILKPIIHLVCMRRFGKNVWPPWIVALTIDLISLLIYKSKERDELTEEQRLELSKRTFGLLLYILRSPFYDKYSKNKIDSFLHSLGKNIPLVGMITLPLANYLPLWQKTYFYTWST